jgi:multiple sugar transport system permease protein/raffinose/stachyose/melibiose transport system permease protein
MRHVRVGYMGKSENVVQNSNNMVDMKDGAYGSKTRVKKRMNMEFWWGMIFILPAVYLALNFKIFPLVRGLYDSLFHFYGGWDAKFVGIENFRRMFEDPVVHQAFLNAVKVMITLPVWVIFPLVLAFFIFQRTPGWKFFRAVYFLPYTIAPIIVGQIFRELLGANGPLNALLIGMGLEAIALPWLGSKVTAVWTMVAVVLWSFNGLGVITYLAGFATISEDIFDAAAIDGVGFWKRIFRIIFPIMLPVIGYWTVLCTGGMLLWMFPFIHALTQGGPGYSSMLPEYLVYITAFRFFERGYGTAIGVGLFVFVLGFTLFQVRYMYTVGSTEAVRVNKRGR